MDLVIVVGEADDPLVVLAVFAPVVAEAGAARAGACWRVAFKH